MPPATQIKRGQTIIVDGQLFRILDLQRITPGKGNAIVQTELRNVKTGIKTEKRFRSNEDVDLADMITRKMQYLYAAENIHYFMDTENYEQYEMSDDLLGENVKFLVTEESYEVDLYEGQPVGIELPPRMTLKIVETDPPQKGSAGKTKPAKTETGLVLKVPLFLAEGDSVVVNTETMEYVERA